MLRTQAVATAAPALVDGVCETLSLAFSQGLWRSTPMAVGSRQCETGSARDMVRRLTRRGTVTYAVVNERHHSPIRPVVLGCVVGAILNEDTIGFFGLGTYGAQPGDGVLGFIAIHPDAQGARLGRVDSADPQSIGPRSASMAGALVSQWMATPDIASCPRLFLRTRQEISAVQHLAVKNGFELRGRFHVDHQGERQDRMVYRREQGMQAANLAGLGAGR